MQFCPVWSREAHLGENVGLGKDHTIFALTAGNVDFRTKANGRVYELDPTLLVGGLGPRLPASLKQLTADFYPAAPANP